MKPSAVRTPLTYEVVWHEDGRTKVICVPEHDRAVREWRSLIRAGKRAALYLGGMRVKGEW